MFAGKNLQWHKKVSDPHKGLENWTIFMDVICVSSLTLKFVLINEGESIESCEKCLLVKTDNGTKKFQTPMGVLKIGQFSWTSYVYHP